MRAATADSLAIDAATVEAVEVLDSDGVASILLKGPAIARLLYDDGEERSWTDADLIVGPGDRGRAQRVLESLGYRPLLSDPLERATVPHAINFVRESGGTEGRGAESIDLHTGFAGVRAAPEAFWISLREDHDRIELFGRPISVPSVPARLALVALHAASHGRVHARAHGDLLRAMSRFGDAEWRAAADLARRWDALDYFVVGVALDTGGPALLSRLGISHDPSRAAAMRSEGMPRAQRGFEQLASTDGLLARAHLVARKLFPSSEAMRLWKPLARRGSRGLALAYLLRLPWLIGQSGLALRSYLTAGRR